MAKVTNDWTDLAWVRRPGVQRWGGVGLVICMLTMLTRLSLVTRNASRTRAAEGPSPRLVSSRLGLGRLVLRCTRVRGDIGLLHMLALTARSSRVRDDGTTTIRHTPAITVRRNRWRPEGLRDGCARKAGKLLSLPAPKTPIYGRHNPVGLTPSAFPTRHDK